jgi:hypothetical protein
VLLVVVLNGCAESLQDRQLIQPTDAQGRDCVAGCELPKSQCEQRQRAREEECQRFYAPAKADYDLCIKSGGGNCSPPDTCLGPDMRICEVQYDDCFQACGGRVEKQMRPLWSKPVAASQTGG